MKILSHRGFWKSITMKNSYDAFVDSINNGWGFETDFRDFNGELVISHDIATNKALKAEKVFELLGKNKDLYIAINIKSDGLKNLIVSEINKYKIENYFVFDMSLPQNIEVIEAKLKYFCRQSEYEIEPLLYDDALGVWMDGFIDNKWITEDLILKHLNNNKMICFVSPELHGREYKEFWEFLRKCNFPSNNIFLCTDIPDEAQKFFKEKE